MGLFDLFKKKDHKDNSTTDTKDTKQPYLGDLEKTGVIYNLIQTPIAKRDHNWQKQFLDAIPKASFRCGDPQIITGPDGFPYFQLFLPEPGKQFQCFVIEKMKDDFLLNNGFGVVINPTDKSADWVLTYGDILNLHINNAFYTTDSPFSKETKDETIKQSEKVMIGQPSETIFPKVTRKLISDFIKMNGFNDPKVLLMMRESKGQFGVTQDIVFNILPSHFENENKYRAVMQTIGWYLPRHYSFVGMDESTLGNGFQEL